MLCPGSAPICCRVHRGPPALRACRARGCEQFLLGGAEPAVEDVLANRAVEQKCFLTNNADMRAEGLKRDAADVLTVNGDAARTGFVKGRQQVYQRGFARAGWAGQ